MTESQYFDPSAWSLVPGRTVHVVIDDQNDFLHPDGWYATHGIDIAHMRRVIEPTKVLNAECRKRGIPIVWTRHGTWGIDDGGPFMAKRVLLTEGGLRIGTWGYEIIDELDVAPRGLDRREDAGSRRSSRRTSSSVLRGARRRDGADHGRAHEPVRRRDLQGRDVPRLQADRGGGVRRHGDAAPPRPGDRDDPASAGGR